MDDPAVDAHGLVPALKFLERVNWLPGGAGLTAELLRAEAPGELVELVDVGTGGADVPRLLWRELRRHGHRVRVVGVDLHARAVEYAQRRCEGLAGVAIVQGDAVALPFRDGAVDYALSTTFLHHLDDAEAVRCLAEMRRIARRGVVVVDLERSRAAYAGVWLVTRAGDPIARHDGPVSVRRAFTAGELARLACAAGLTGARITRHLPFKLALVARTG